MKKQKKVLFLARSTDGAIWSLNEDGRTYSNKDHKEHFPDSHHFKYSKEKLISCGFYPVLKSDFKKLKKKNKEYCEFLSWQSRPDGHGGAKGGTIEEFKKYKNKLKK